MIEPASAAMRLGPYVLGERLGLGGMAEVYIGQRAGPHGFAKKFAIKRILPELAKDPRFVAMFVDEARICAALQHPNIIQVVDFGESDGELFMAMEYVDGASVARLLRSVAGKRERFPLSILCLIARDVLRGLAYAHEALSEEGGPLGLVHRDVSPGNVLISRAGEVKLGDFGIVRSAVVDRRTHPGELKGKLGYMSPEQVIGAEVDPRSDLFAVGILLAEMLITCPLFGGKNELEILTRIHDADLATFERRLEGVPPELAAIARHALAREPRARFQTAREFAQAIDQFADQNHLVLDQNELAHWTESLGVLPSRSGTHALPPPESVRQIVSEPTRRLGPEPKHSQQQIRRPTPPALSLDDGRAAGRIDLIELCATGRVRRRTKLVGRDGIGRPAAEVPGTAELLRKPAFQFGEPENAAAAWSAPLEARTLPARLYSLALQEATGLLVARLGPREKRVFFVDGEPRCVTSSLRDELLGYRLLARGTVDEATLRAALDSRTRCGMHLGEILVSVGALLPTVLLRELVEQLEDRFVELLGWREGTLWFFDGVRSGEEELRAQLPAPALITRGIRERFGAEEIAGLLAGSARAVLFRGDARGIDPVRLGVTTPERRALERAVQAGTLERLVAIAENERFATATDALAASFIGLSVGLISAPGAGVGVGGARGLGV
jgi:serine/threonine-protein kinase